MLPVYCFCPSSSLYHAILISWKPVFVQIAYCIFRTNRSATYAFIIWSEIERRPSVGRFSTTKCNCSGSSCSFKTTCSLFFNYSLPPSGRSPGILVTAAAFHSISQVYKQSSTQNQWITRTGVHLSNSTGSSWWNVWDPNHQLSDIRGMWHICIMVSIPQVHW